MTVFRRSEKERDFHSKKFANLAGAGRSTLAGTENQKREMNRNEFFSFLIIFIKNEDTDKLLNAMGIYTVNFMVFDAETKQSEGLTAKTRSVNFSEGT